MSIHFQINVDGDDADHAIAEFRKVFGAMVGATPAVAAGAVTAGVEAVQGTYPLPQTAPISPEVVKAALGEPPEPAPKKTRKTKDKAPEVIDNAPLADATSVAEKVDATTSTSSTAEKSETSASTASSVPDIDAVRAKLKELGATDGLGHDKVFEVLGKYNAKNASTVPEDRRAELITEIDELLAGAA